MGCALLQVGGQVDDGHRLEGTFFHANAAADAEGLGYGGDPGGGGTLWWLWW